MEDRRGEEGRARGWVLTDGVGQERRDVLKVFVKSMREGERKMVERLQSRHDNHPNKQGTSNRIRNNSIHTLKQRNTLIPDHLKNPTPTITHPLRIPRIHARRKLALRS